MKITAAKAIPSAYERSGIARNYIYVKIETDQGLVGWGEATSGPLSVASMSGSPESPRANTRIGSIRFHCEHARCRGCGRAVLFFVSEGSKHLTAQIALVAEFLKSNAGHCDVDINPVH